jgi:glycosyltransferase involved in cell wall biosynthesis
VSTAAILVNRAALAIGACAVRALYVDCDVLASPASGVATYLREVLARLEGEIVRRPAQPRVGAPGRARLRRVPGAYALRALRQAWPPIPRGAIYWSPNFILPPFVPPRCVVTIHDTIFLDTPEWADAVRGAFFRARVSGTLRRAARVIVPSKAVAQRLRDIEPRAQVVVIPYGVRALEAPPEPRRTVLYFGNIEPRKDLATLVRAHARMPSALRAAHPLIIAGNVADETYARGLGVALTPRPSEQELARLLAGAAVVVSPSRAEGFGLVPLEALVAGAPVIAADIAVTRDVLGDAADYFPPGDDAALAMLLSERLVAPRLPSPLQRAALRERFNWDVCARAHADLFASLS